MVVKKVIDHSLREAGRQFITSLKASNRYSESYLASLETTVAMAATFAEEQVWPGVRGLTVSHMEAYLAYLQGRTRWFGEREYAEPKKLSKGHINCQYRRLHRFFNWLVEREFVDGNPLHLIKPPSVDEKTVPVVTEDQIRDLLTLTDPALARTSAHRFRLAPTGPCFTCSGIPRGGWPRPQSSASMTWTWERARSLLWEKAARSTACPSGLSRSLPRRTRNWVVTTNSLRPLSG